MPRFSTDDIRRRLERFPKVDLIHLPTPFRKLGNLSANFGGPQIYIKRDDLTGLAFGGNKSRKLEYIVRDILDKKADAVITWASVQSNWCMQTAAAARRFALRPVLVLYRTSDQAPEYDGNLLLDFVLEADIRILEARRGKVIRPEQAMSTLEGIAAELRGEGLRPYIVPVGGSLVRGDMDRPLGAIAYVEACVETMEQARAAGIEPDFLIHSTGSGGTQAGLVLGAKAVSDRCRVVGISVSDPKGPFASDVLEICRAADAALGTELGVDPGDVIVDDNYIRDGYGHVDREVAGIIRRVFQLEGIVLDPIYTAKAMIGLADLVQRGFFKSSDTVVFFHTGGTPALFPSRDLLVDYLRK